MGFMVAFCYLLILITVSLSQAQRIIKDVCSLNFDTGPCKADGELWYFNKQSGKCETFIFGGCGGNENKFASKTACESRCKPPTTTLPPIKDVCSLNFAIGPCKARMPLWYFNKQSGKCETFIFGGCGGNENKFASKTACESRCKPPTTTLPVIKDVCSLNFATGPCKASMPRWFFNAKNGKCETFIFGGCGGNENNFVLKTACESRCKPPTTTLPAIKDVCSMNFDTGRCLAYVPSWYFNKKSGKCETFIFGGCGGNENKFASKTACESRCKPPTTTLPGIKDACSLNFATGHCKASMQRWFFNAKNGKCESFIFGGCGGNENNFRSKTECEIRCPRLQLLKI